MFDVVLYEPEIPPNTGNVIRLCANTGARLHLVEPLGFRMEDKALRRAGLDYHEYAAVQVHQNFAALQVALNDPALPPRRYFALSTKNSLPFMEVQFQANDVLVFGPETRGLPADLLAQFAEDRRIRIPMRAGQRSLNLSNAVAVVVFEAWRQLDFAGGL